MEFECDILLVKNSMSHIVEAHIRPTHRTLHSE